MSSTNPYKANFNPRLLAARVLREVLAGRSLSEALPRHLEKIDDPRDRAFAQELCYGVMRWHPRLDGILRLLLKKPLKSKDGDIQALLLLGLYQLLHLRVAEHAAVHETAGGAARFGKRWGVGLINGVLREFQRNRDALLEKVDQDPALANAMPVWLLQATRQQWPESWQERLTALNGRPPMSLRVNRLQRSRESYLDQLRAAGIDAVPIPATQSGLILDKPLDVDQLPGFAEGLVSVQDGGAQLAAELLELRPGQRVLDACAAPGGKTCHILEMANDLQVTAVDVEVARLESVRENLTRLRLRAAVEQGDASQPAGEWSHRRYERILLDVPCSATGVLRRHPDIKYLRRAEDVPKLVALQSRILRAVWPLLEPGGLLLYATCSILPDENERQVQAFLREEPSAKERPITAGWGEARAVGRQLAPGEGNMDGFFYALLEKARA